MADPAITFFHDDSTPDGGTPVDADNPLALGTVEKGMVSDTIVLHLWNDKTEEVGSDTAESPRFYAISDDDISDVFAGTASNNFESMLEARSCGAYNAAADQDSEWTPIGPGKYLVLGDMPPGSMREIEIRLNVPIDAVAHAAVKNMQYRVSM